MTKSLMDYLQLSFGGLHARNVVDLASKTLTYYSDAAGIPDHINILEDAQKKDQLSQLPIPDVNRMSISAKSILQDQAFIPKMN